MKKILILPDVHGRSFWKESIDKFLDEFPMEKEENKDNKIIFLGDYIDPYVWHDHVTEEEAYNNLFELLGKVVDLNAKYANSVIMLLGNHDLHYIYDTGEDCRVDYNRFPHYRKIFQTLIESKQIQLAYATTMQENSGMNWLFSHAGIQLGWLQHTMKVHGAEMNDITASSVADWLNTHMQDIMKQLAEVSYHRGGYDRYGSCLWADLHEMMGNNMISIHSDQLQHGRVNQVFAHTYSEEPYIDEETGIYMIDTGFSSYLLDENDKLQVYTKGSRYTYGS